MRKHIYTHIFANQKVTHGNVVQARNSSIINIGDSACVLRVVWVGFYILTNFNDKKAHRDLLGLSTHSMKSIVGKENTSDRCSNHSRVYHQHSILHFSNPLDALTSKR